MLQNELHSYTGMGGTSWTGLSSILMTLYRYDIVRQISQANKPSKINDEEVDEVEYLPALQVFVVIQLIYVEFKSKEYQGCIKQGIRN